MADPVISASIARELASYHKIVIEKNSGSELFNTIRRWISVIPESFDTDEKNEFFRLHFGGVEKLATKSACMETSLEEIGSKVTFCHCDLLNGNIILSPGDKGTVKFIDYGLLRIL
jgi:ethanolamine kinase